MKDKEKQVEEMAQFIDSCETSTYNACLKVAKHLVEKQGYQKLPKDSVVLSREEFEQLAIEYKRWEKLAIEDMLTQARKETAEKIFGQIIWYAVKRIGQTSNDSYYQISFDRLNELAKEFGVEIKE